MPVARRVRARRPRPGQDRQPAQRLHPGLADEPAGQRLHQRGVEPVAASRRPSRDGRASRRGRSSATGRARRAGRSRPRPTGRRASRRRGRPRGAGTRRSATPQPSIAVRSFSGVVPNARATAAAVGDLGRDGPRASSRSASQPWSRDSRIETECWPEHMWRIGPGCSPSRARRVAVSASSGMPSIAGRDQRLADARPGGTSPGSSGRGGPRPSASWP